MQPLSSSHPGPSFPPRIDRPGMAAAVGLHKQEGMHVTLLLQVCVLQVCCCFCPALPPHSCLCLPRMDLHGLPCPVFVRIGSDRIVVPGWLRGVTSNSDQNRNAKQGSRVGASNTSLLLSQGLHLSGRRCIHPPSLFCEAYFGRARKLTCAHLVST